MTPEQLKEIGNLLYGERWQAPLARDLGVNVRTVARWATGEIVMRYGVERDIVALCKRRINNLQKVVDAYIQSTPQAGSGVYI